MLILQFHFVLTWGVIFLRLGKCGIRVAGKGTYICVNGPRLETAAENQGLFCAGADMVGMTGMPEAFLQRTGGMFCSNIRYNNMLPEYPVKNSTATEVASPWSVGWKNKGSAQGFFWRWIILSQLPPASGFKKCKDVKEALVEKLFYKICGGNYNIADNPGCRR